MSRNFERPVLAILALAGALGTVGAPAGAAGFAAAWGVLGFGAGWMAARRLLPESPTPMLIALGLALSPALTGGIATVLLYSGLGSAAAARALLLGCALWAALEARAAGSKAAREPDPAPARHLYLPALLWTGFVTALLLGNSYLPPRSDGWFHAAVVERIALLGLPPEDPFFAGIRLLYFWGYHVWAALFLGLWPDLPVLAPLVAFNLSAALAAPLALLLLAYRLGATPGQAWLTAGLATLGYYPGSWIWIVARSLAGDVRGWEEIHRLTVNGVSPALQTMATGTMHASMVTFADKFLVLTPFSMAFAFMALFALLWLRFLERPSLRVGLALGLLQAAALFLHSVAGWAQAMCAAAAWGWMAVRAIRDPGARRALLPIALVFGLSTLLVLPYAWVTTHGKSGSAALRFTPVALSTLLIAGLAVVPAGAVQLQRWAAARQEAGRLLPFTVALAAAALLIRLPENNQSKFLNLLFLLLAFPAAAAWSRWTAGRHPWARRALWAVAGVALLPSVALVAWSFASEHGQAVDSIPRTTAAERAAFAWARAHTPPTTAFADEGGGEDLVVRAARGSLWGGPGYEDNWGYPEAELRVRKQATLALGAGRALDVEQRALLRRLDRPIVVVARRRYADRPGSAWSVSRAGGSYRLLFANDEIRLYRWEEAP